MVGSGRMKYQDLASRIPSTYSAANCTDKITRTAQGWHKPNANLRVSALMHWQFDGKGGGGI